MAYIALRTTLWDAMNAKQKSCAVAMLSNISMPDPDSVGTAKYLHNPTGLTWFLWEDGRIRADDVALWGAFCTNFVAIVGPLTIVNMDEATLRATLWTAAQPFLNWPLTVPNDVDPFLWVIQQQGVVLGNTFACQNFPYASVTFI